MLKTIGLLILLAIAGVLIYAATLPDAFRVERSILIQAPAAKIFPYINEYKSWTIWSPYEKKDPAMKRSYSEPSAGKGATYAWQGNKEIGEGKMEMLESVPPSKIRIDLQFFKPFEARNTAEFSLIPEGEATRVTWAMYGPSPYLSKLMGVFINMDRMIGQDFETGLSNLKAAAEK